MGVQPGNPLVGGINLRIPAIQSPNYVAGVSGWSVRIDGSAEFNNLTIRGQFEGTDFVINSSGAFFYSGTPAAGNLTASITNAAGTDAETNAYLAGFTTYGTVGGVLTAVQINGSTLRWSTAATEAGPWAGASEIQQDGLGNLILASMFGATLGTVVNDQLVVQNIVPYQPGTSSPETWHALGSMSAGWSASGHAQYRISAEGELWLSFKDIVPGTTVADGTVIWSAANGLPASYRPANNRRILCYSTGQTGNVGGCAFELETDGSIQCYGFTKTSTGRADLYALVPISE